MSTFSLDADSLFSMYESPHSLTNVIFFLYGVYTDADPIRTNCLYATVMIVVMNFLAIRENNTRKRRCLYFNLGLPALLV